MTDVVYVQVVTLVMKLVFLIVHRVFQNVQKLVELGMVTNVGEDLKLEIYVVYVVMNL